MDIYDDYRPYEPRVDGVIGSGPALPGRDKNGRFVPSRLRDDDGVIIYESGFITLEEISNEAAIDFEDAETAKARIYGSDPDDPYVAEDENPDYEEFEEIAREAAYDWRDEYDLSLEASSDEFANAFVNAHYGHLWESDNEDAYDAVEAEVNRKALHRERHGYYEDPGRARQPSRKGKYYLIFDRNKIRENRTSRDLIFEMTEMTSEHFLDAHREHDERYADEVTINDLSLMELDQAYQRGEFDEELVAAEAVLSDLYDWDSGWYDEYHMSDPTDDPIDPQLDEWGWEDDVYPTSFAEDDAEMASEEAKEEAFEKLYEHLPATLAAGSRIQKTFGYT